jgi:hypothetical protein
VKKGSAEIVAETAGELPVTDLGLRTTISSSLKEENGVVLEDEACGDDLLDIGVCGEVFVSEDLEGFYFWRDVEAFDVAVDGLLFAAHIFSVIELATLIAS